MMATRFVSGAAWLLVKAVAQGSSSATCDSRTIMTITSSLLA